MNKLFDIILFLGDIVFAAVCMEGLLCSFLFSTFIYPSILALSINLIECKRDVLIHF